MEEAGPELEVQADELVPIEHETLLDKEEETPTFDELEIEEFAQELGAFFEDIERL